MLSPSEGGEVLVYLPGSSFWNTFQNHLFKIKRRAGQLAAQLRAPADPRTHTAAHNHMENPSSRGSNRHHKHAGNTLIKANI